MLSSSCWQVAEMAQLAQVLGEVPPAAAHAPRYGLYLLHLIGLLIAQSLFHPAWGWQLLTTKALGFFITVILAFAPYRWIESPSPRMADEGPFRHRAKQARLMRAMGGGRSWIR